VKLTYERRSGQFYGKNVTKTRVVTINDQMRAVSAVFLDTPHAAARYPRSLYNQVGNEIFRDDHKFLPYLQAHSRHIESKMHSGPDLARSISQHATTFLWLVSIRFWGPGPLR
jgi:hypothetical protein